MEQDSLTAQTRKMLAEFSRQTWDGSEESNQQILLVQGPIGSGKSTVLTSLRQMCNPLTTIFFDEGERIPGESEGPFIVHTLRPGQTVEADDDVPITVVELALIERPIKRGWYWLVAMDSPYAPYPVYVHHANEEKGFYVRMEPGDTEPTFYTGDTYIDDLIPIKLPTIDEVPPKARDLIREIMEEDYADKVFAYSE